MTGGTAGTYETGDKWNGYNFADRKCTSKDLVGTSGRIFSQGAYFDVPYGVTDIYMSGICTYQQYEKYFSARRLGINSGRIYTAILLK